MIYLIALLGFIAFILVLIVVVGIIPALLVMFFGAVVFAVTLFLMKKYFGVVL